MSQPSVSGIVLAGGASRRMGFSKATARLGTVTLFERVLAAVKLLSDDVVVVANESGPWDLAGVRILADVYPGAGTLGGIYSGLNVAHYEHALVVACDMPFLSLELWRYMLEQPRDRDILMPRVAGLAEPLHAIYSRRCLQPIQRLLDIRSFRIVNLLDCVSARFLEEDEIDRFDPQHRSFFNVNTPEDLTRAMAMLAEETA